MKILGMDIESDFYRRKEDFRSNKERGFECDLPILKAILSLFGR